MDACAYAEARVGMVLLSTTRYELPLARLNTEPPIVTAGPPAVSVVPSTTITELSVMVTGRFGGSLVTGKGVNAVPPGDADRGRVMRLASLPAAVANTSTGLPFGKGALERETICPSGSVTAGDPGNSVVPGPRTTDEAPGGIVMTGPSLLVPSVTTIGVGTAGPAVPGPAGGIVRLTVLLLPPKIRNWGPFTVVGVAREITVPSGSVTPDDPGNIVVPEPRTILETPGEMVTRELPTVATTGGVGTSAGLAVVTGTGLRSMVVTGS